MVSEVYKAVKMSPMYRCGPTAPGEHWVGLEEDEGHWRWSSDGVVVVTEGKLENKGGGHAVAATEGLWKRVNNAEERTVVCEARLRCLTEPLFPMTSTFNTSENTVTVHGIEFRSLGRNEKFQKAKELCENNGTRLPQYPSVVTQNIVVKRFGEHWIGLEKDGDRWIWGGEANTKNTGTNDNEPGHVIVTAERTKTSVPKNASHNVVCEAKFADVCPNRDEHVKEIVTLDNRCYYTHKNKLTFSEADTFCRKMGARLAAYKLGNSIMDGFDPSDQVNDYWIEMPNGTYMYTANGPFAATDREVGVVCEGGLELYNVNDEDYITSPELQADVVMDDRPTNCSLVDPPVVKMQFQRSHHLREIIIYTNSSNLESVQINATPPCTYYFSLHEVHEVFLGCDEKTTALEMMFNTTEHSDLILCGIDVMAGSNTTAFKTPLTTTTDTKTTTTTATDAITTTATEIQTTTSEADTTTSTATDTTSTASDTTSTATDTTSTASETTSETATTSTATDPTFAETTVKPLGVDRMGRKIFKKCICRCRNLKAAPSKPEAVAEKVTELKKNVSVNSKDMTKSILKKTSRVDKRSSAVVIGWAYLIVVAVPFMAVVFGDILKVMTWFCI
ncbi:uncharacterized protein LOC124276707, partial [Haliotis rubra]|uniref:uncharacterized protein LOC124276707 n=1 Tax=Haliotis rubra TaxID=36100 RepID=UPI001EE62C4E